MLPVYLFAGQGCQYNRMGLDFYRSNKVFADTMQSLDNYVKKSAGFSVLDKLYGSEAFNATERWPTVYSHLSIFMVEYSVACVLLNRGILPSIVVGYSLGEFAACAIAGQLNPFSIIDVVIAHARSIEKNCDRGGMLAVLGDSEELFTMLEKASKISLAAINTPNHFVIAGTNEELLKSREKLDRRSVICAEVPVEYAFHSPSILPAKAYFLNTAATLSPVKTNLSFVSARTGDRLEQVTAEDLWMATVNQIRFDRALRFVENSTSARAIYIDVSPSGTLSGFVSQMLGSDRAENNVFSLVTPFGYEMKKLISLEKILQGSKSTIQPKELKMTAYMFPGQGSQAKGMGKGLFSAFPDLTRKADEILGYSIEELCIDDPQTKLNLTQFTQPALFTVCALSYLVKKEKAGCLPDVTLGHSLGEYCALFAAEVFDFETGLRLVQRRGQLMSEASGGCMAAVIGLTEEKLRDALDEASLTDVDIANLNSPHQIVISGPTISIDKAGKILSNHGAKAVVPLKVSAAFHSRYMVKASKEFEAFVQGFVFKAPQFPVYSNVTARYHQPSSIKDLLVRQMVSPVKWSESIRVLLGIGVTDFAEIGHGNVLTNLVKRIKSEAAEPLKLPSTETTYVVPQTIFERKVILADSIPDVKKDFVSTSNVSMEYTLNAEVELQGNANSSMGAELLGSSEFKNTYDLTYAYVVGGMERGISSVKMVVQARKAGMMGFFGVHRMPLNEIEQGIVAIKNLMNNRPCFGVNIVSDLDNPAEEDKIVDVLFRHDVRVIEASNFLQITPALVRYRLKGIALNSLGVVTPVNRIIAKVSRLELAKMFMEPASMVLVDSLLHSGQITRQEAELSQKIPMSCDICVESDSAGYSNGVSYALQSVVLQMRNSKARKNPSDPLIRIGFAGGLGTPETIAAAFMAGADFVLTGSINQCTVEADTSDTVKDLLANAGIHDTDLAPVAGNFTVGQQTRLLKKGVFFPARAKKLSDIYRQNESLENVPESLRKQFEEKYFKCTYPEVFEKCKALYDNTEVASAQNNPRKRMGLLFRWYLDQAAEWAIKGANENRVDFQIRCSPALGAFNYWVQETELADWRKRHVDKIGLLLMQSAAQHIVEKIKIFPKLLVQENI